MAWSSPTRLLDAKERGNNTVIVTTRRGRDNKCQTSACEEIGGPELDPTQEDQEDDEGTQAQTSEPNREG